MLSIYGRGYMFLRYYNRRIRKKTLLRFCFPFPSFLTGQKNDSHGLSLADKKSLAIATNLSNLVPRKNLTTVRRNGGSH